VAVLKLEKNFKDLYEKPLECNEGGGQGCSSYLFKVFILNRSTVGAFVVPFRVLSRKNMTGEKVLR